MVLVSAKKRGTNFEYRVAHLFERFGYSWDRSRSSMNIDLKISKDGRLRYLVNCKKTSEVGPIYVSRLEIERLAAQAEQTGAEGLVCFGFGRTPILVLTLDQISCLKATRLNYKLYPNDGRPLMEFLTEEGAKNNPARSRHAQA